MKIVIDIYDEQYEIIKKIVKNQNSVCPDTDSAEKIILNGTPLPKGHGRLKDIDKIISDGISKGFCDWYDEMKYAETIIEADKEEEEDEFFTTG